MTRVIGEVYETGSVSIDSVDLVVTPLNRVRATGKLTEGLSYDPGNGKIFPSETAS